MLCCMTSTGSPLDTYQPYRGLPPMAGLCSIREAADPGLSVESCVARLKRYHYAFKRLHEILIARLTAEPIYELKMALSLHAHLCAEHVQVLRARVAEMREPPLGLDVVPDTNLQVFFDEILCSPTTESLLVGIYDKALPALRQALGRHIAETNRMVDHPSVRLCRFALLEVDDMVDYGAKAIACLVDDATRSTLSPWLSSLDQALAAAGGLDGSQPRSTSPAQRTYSVKPFVFDPKPQRDERFKDPYNRGVNAEAFLYDPTMPENAKTLMLYFKRLREIDVPEMIASIIHQTSGKPWGYYRDMTRQLWDEARHAMMGEVGFIANGVDWTEARITWTWSRNLNTQLSPAERHAVLFFIEQSLMPKSGKRYEWEVGVGSGDPLAALFQDYDWADEVLHARIGRDWFVKDFADPKDAIKTGDECWSKVSSDYGEQLERGLTQHENWWPRVYLAACRHWGTEPDRRVLDWHISYETRRADLKVIEASG